jgi:hypothetical protein
MSRQCDHVACTKDLLDWFHWAVEQDEPEDAVRLILLAVERRKDVLRKESDPVWVGVHRVLTEDDSDDLDFDAGDYPLRLCIHGGDWLHGGRRTVSLVEADELPELVEALRAIEQPWVVDRLLAMQRRLSPRFDSWDMHDFGEGVWYEIECLREFYEKAAAAKLPVICTISH